MWKYIEDNIIDPVYEIDVFVRGKFITSANIRSLKVDVKEDIEQVWGYKKDTINVIRYPRKLPYNWEITSRTLDGRVYTNPLNGEKKIIKGMEHGKNYIYKWRISLTILYFKFTGFLRIFLPKQWS